MFFSITLTHVCLIEVEISLQLLLKSVGSKTLYWRASVLIEL